MQEYILWIHEESKTYVNKLISARLFLIRSKNNEFEITIQRPLVSLIINILKNHTLFLFKQLIEIAVIDRPNKYNRFKINYVMTSITFNTRIILSLEMKEIDIVNSVIEHFNSSEWLEREAWDLYGVYFEGNKNLRRIVTDYGFKGHPLRKDFPLTGFVEIYYNDEEKRLVYEPVELAQEYRVFSLQNPWTPLT